MTTTHELQPMPTALQPYSPTAHALNRHLPAFHLTLHALKNSKSMSRIDNLDNLTRILLRAQIRALSRRQVILLGLKP